MTRSKTIKELRKYFSISELVCDHTLKRFGDAGWVYLDTLALRVLLVLRRDILQVPLVINTGNRKQRGLRCNCCQLVADKTKQGQNYLSFHILGKAFDINAVGNVMTAKEMRQRIIEKQDLLPCPVRMEKGVSWLHIDIMDPTDGEQKIVLF